MLKTLSLLFFLFFFHFLSVSLIFTQSAAFSKVFALKHSFFSNIILNLHKAIFYIRKKRTYSSFNARITRLPMREYFFPNFYRIPKIWPPSTFNYQHATFSFPFSFISSFIFRSRYSSHIHFSSHWIYLCKINSVSFLLSTHVKIHYIP